MSELFRRHGGDWVPIPEVLYNEGTATVSLDPPTDKTVDNFNHNDLGTYYANVGSWETSTAVARQQGWGLSAPDTVSADMVSMPTASHVDQAEALNSYPRGGERFDIWVNPHGYTGSGELRVYFGRQSYDTSEGYYLEISDNGVFVFESDGTTSSAFIFHNSLLPGSSWYRIQIGWPSDPLNQDWLLDIETAGGTHIATETGRPSANEFTYGGVGFSTFGDIPGAFDDWSRTGSYAPSEDNIAWVDNFEHGDLDTYYNNPEGTITSTSARTGSYGLSLPSSFVDHYFSMPESEGDQTDTLDRYPEIGDSFEWWFRPDSMGDIPIQRVCWASQTSEDSSNLYRAHITISKVRLHRRLDSVTEELFDLDVPFQVGDWYRFVVDWNTDWTFTITVYDEDGNQLGTGSGSDPAQAFTGGGVGYFSNGQSSMSFDDWRILNGASGSIAHVREPVGSPAVWFPLRESDDLEPRSWIEDDGEWVQNFTGSIDGATWSPMDDWMGCAALTGDGTGHALLSPWGTFGSTAGNTFAVGLTVKMDDPQTNVALIGVDSPGQNFEISSAALEDETGNVEAGFYDGSDWVYVMTDGGIIDDGERHQIYWISEGGSASDQSIYIDGSLVSTSTWGESGDPSLVDFSVDVSLLGANSGSNIERPIAATVDDVVAYTYPEQDAPEDYDRQPWVAN